MRQLAFAVGLLALGWVAATPARADFTVVRFESGHCQIWWNSADNPLGVGWTKIALGLPDYPSAWAALANAVAQRVCL